MTTLNTLQSAGEVQCGKKNRTRPRLCLESFLLEGLRNLKERYCCITCAIARELTCKSVFRFPLSVVKGGYYLKADPAGV